MTLGLGELRGNAHFDATSRWFARRSEARAVVRDSDSPATRQAADAEPASIPAATGPPAWLPRSDLFAWGGFVLSLVLWATALANVHIGTLPTAGMGLVKILPVTFWASAGVLMVSFSFAVARRSTRWPVLAVHLFALVAILHATPAILYGTLRYSWAWKHIGVVDFISHNGIDFGLGGILGPYQGWPGFFALNSFLTSDSGLCSSLSYAQWALPVNDLLWLGPVILIARAFTADKRLVWTAAWLFTLGNWIGQDYFSPQAFAYFLYLTVLALCIRWFWVPRTSDARRSPRSKSARYALLACLLPLMAAIASSHQLTPFMLISALTVLAVFSQIRPRVLLPAAMTVITIGWLAYGARAWLVRNSFQLVQGLGLPWSNTSAHLVSQGSVPSDQILVDWAARGLSAAISLLAVIGFFRYRHHHNARARRSWRRVALLAVAPIPALAANNYGGEILFRVYLFAVPFLAIAAAAAFFPHPRVGRPLRTAVPFAATLLVLSAGYALGNFGQESMNYFSPREVAASDWLYRTAPRGAQIVAADSNYPWAFVHYNWYSYTFLDSISGSLGEAVLRTPADTVAGLMEQGHPPTAYLILTESQAAEIDLSGTWPTGAYSRITNDLLASSRFRVVYRNPDVLILQLAGAGSQSRAP